VFESLIDSNLAYEKQDWQERDLNFLAPMPFSANWSEMGCFKTSTGLWLMERKKIRNALIITSKMGKGAYFSDFYRCLPESWQLYNVNLHDVSLRVMDYERKANMNDLLNTIDTGFHNHPIVFLCHYDIFTKNSNDNTAAKDPNGIGLVDKFKKIEWDMIMCDEAHKLKNPDTQWTMNIKRLTARNKHIMTGTGFVNNPAEIWSLLKFLDRTFRNIGRPDLAGYWNFRAYFCDEFVDGRGYRYIRGIKQNRIEEFRQLRKKVGPRHRMREVHPDIPEPITNSYDVNLNATQRTMYDEIKSVLQTLDQQGQILSSPNVLSQLNRLRQISVATPKVNNAGFNSKAGRFVHDISLVEPSSKLDEVMDLLKELDDQVVVFSNFTDPLDLLEKRLDKAGIPYLYMKQSHSEAKRYHLWKELWPTKQHKVFMCTLALGGESINLASASHMIFLDRSWSPKDMIQAIGRVHRPGQEGTAQAIYINARNTVDSYVSGRLKLKAKWFNDIFGDGKEQS
jgi:SNF2 family DNA or RNA helicase